MSYLTPAPGDHVGELEAKRSRFVATVRRIADVTGAEQLLADQRRLHPSARHHCSAWVLGPDRTVVRAQDDGEPSGTAGVPMLNVLLGAGLGDVAAVVVRYFGGTLLGAGGLARAYSGAVAEALAGAGTVRRVQREVFEIAVPHTRAGPLESLLRSRGANIEQVEYTDEVRLRVVVRTGQGESLPALLAGATAGAATVRSDGLVWVDD